MHQEPWAAAVLLVSLAVAFAGVFGKIQPMVFGSTDAPPFAPPAGPLVPVFTHMALVLLVGLYISPFLVECVSPRGAVFG